jgi:integrase/recombinase XerD
LLDEFRDALWLEDGLSRNTLDSYRRDLRLFSHGFCPTAVSPCCKDSAWIFSTTWLTSFSAGRGRALRPRLLSSLKRFYRYLT